MLFELLTSNPIAFLFVISTLILSLTVHEYAHAYVADRLGDDTPRLLGRVSLNPLRHLDPIGTLLLIFAGFGWGKPVPFNPINLDHPKRDSALIAFAGPLSNFILAAFAAILYARVDSNSILSIFSYLMIIYNVSLGVFNLLPVHPLDGFKVVAGILPKNLYIDWMEMERYGMFILLILVFTDGIRVVMKPIINVLLKIYGI